MSPYRRPVTPSIEVVDVAPDPFPSFSKVVEEAMREGKAKRLCRLAAIEKAAKRLVRASQMADQARSAFPEGHDLNRRLSDAVIRAFLGLERALVAASPRP